MTDEMIEMEFMHLHLDKLEADRKSGKESYHDPDYAAWEAEQVQRSAEWAAQNPPIPAPSNDGEEWVEVE